MEICHVASARKGVQYVLPTHVGKKDNLIMYAMRALR